jgi:hypothetical protein
MSRETAGLERAAQAMLRTLGADRAWLLLPQPAAVNGRTGLGLTAPLVNEVEMEPVLLQASSNGKTLLARLTQDTLQKALGSSGAADTDESATKKMLESSMLRAAGTEYFIVAVTVKWFGGQELLYELEIEE